MFRFTLPRDIYCGHGAIDELSLLKGHKKAFICTGGHSMRAGGFLQKTEKVLQDLPPIRSKASHRIHPSKKCRRARS